MSRNSDNLTKSLNKLKEMSQEFNKVSNNGYEEVSQEFNKVSINGYVCDISSEESINDSLKKIDNKFGNIEVLVNSAAINSDKLLISASSGLINDIIDTNLKGTIFMCKAILKQMIRQRKGSIVNIGLTLN
jgi:3-oxoacyl-[acyl-carrier protein] reductase